MHHHPADPFGELRRQRQRHRATGPTPKERRGPADVERVQQADHLAGQLGARDVRERVGGAGRARKTGHVEGGEGEVAGERVEDAGEGVGVPLARGEEDQVRPGAVAEGVPEDAVVRGGDLEAGELVGHGWWQMGWGWVAFLARVFFLSFGLTQMESWVLLL